MLGDLLYALTPRDQVGLPLQLYTDFKSQVDGAIAVHSTIFVFPAEKLLFIHGLGFDITTGGALVGVTALLTMDGSKFYRLAAHGVSDASHIWSPGGTYYGTIGLDVDVILPPNSQLLIQYQLAAAAAATINTTLYGMQIPRGNVGMP